MLRARLGPLPAPIERRVEAAAPRELERWAERVLDAGSFDDVFG